MKAAEQAHAFTGALLGDHGEALSGLKVTVTPLYAPGPRTRWVPARADLVASAVLDYAGEGKALGVYVGMGLTQGPRAINPETQVPYKRLANADVDALVSLWVDIDIAGAAHGFEKPLAPDLGTAVAIAMSTGLPPTALVNTGHGVQGHWRLHEAMVFGATDVDDDGAPIIDADRVAADHARATELVWAWVTSLRIRAKRLGNYYVDPTTDLARLTRAPGGVNRKLADDVRPVTLIECDATRAYDLDQITAVLAPERLLASYRHESEASGTDLDGIDLPGLWAAARSHPNHEPDWMTAVVESGWAPELADIWTGRADARYGNDDSNIDMALVAAILGAELPLEFAVEAVMCRRLRINRRVEKVDPARRARYYLNRTVGRVAARIRAQAATRVNALESIQEAVDEARADATPIQVAAKSVPSDLQAAPDPAADDDQGVDQPPGVSPEDPGGPGLEAADEASSAVEQPPTNVGDEGATYNDNGVALGVAEPESTDNDASLHSTPDNESLPTIAPPVLRVVTDEPDPETEHADAPRAPRQGLEGPIPSKVTLDEYPLAAALSGQLGLPAGVTVWAVGWRRLEKVDELRLWLHRTTATAVHGGPWRPGTVAATRWHPKPEWGAQPRVADLIFDDLHLSVNVERTWHTAGRQALYRLARKMPGGTPEDVVRLAILGVLHRSTATMVFTTAVTTRDPWISPEGEVWMPTANVRESIRGLGYKPQGAVDMVDVLGELRCKTVTRLSEPQGHRLVTDEAQWVRLSDELAEPEVWTNVAARATERDAQELRDNVRDLNA